MNTLSEHGTNSQPTEHKPGSSRRNLRTFLPNLLLSWLVPLIAYELISPHVHSDLLVLTISAAIPALITVGTFVFLRRVNVIGLIGTAGFAVGLAVSVFTGGNELAIKLHEPALTGTIGLIFLVSVAIGRPLFLLVHRLLNRSGTAAPLPDRRRASVLSALIGATLLVHGIVITILAVTLPTSTFLALSRPVGLPILAIGIGVLFWYGRRSASVSRQGNQAGGLY
jgi:hypothetical protein